MEFNTNRPIFIQISDSICEKILGGEISAGERILSVRDLGAELGVNPNTVARSYERLTSAGIIYNRRGIGYFISDDARERIREEQKRIFLAEELPAVIRKMRLLGIGSSELLAAIERENGD